MLKNTFKLTLFLLLITSAQAYTNLTGCGTITAGNQNYQITAGTMSSASGPCLTINGSGTNTVDVTCTTGVGALTIVSTDNSAPAVSIVNSSGAVRFHACGFTGPVNAVTISGSSYANIDGRGQFGTGGGNAVSGNIYSSGSNHTTVTYMAFGATSAMIFGDDDYPTISYSTFTWGTSTCCQAAIKISPVAGSHVTSSAQIYGNTIDGGWDQSTGTGLDDGMYIVGCSYCVIQVNTIKKVWDGGVEFAGPIDNMQFTLNVISAVGVAAINGYYNFSLSNSSIDATRFCNGNWGTGGGNTTCNSSNLNGHNSKFLDFTNVTGYITGWNTQTVNFSNNSITNNCVFTPNSSVGSCTPSWGGSGVTKYTGGTSINIDMTAHDSGGYNYSSSSFTSNWIDYNQTSGDTIVITGSVTPTISASGNKCGTASSLLSCATLP